MKFILTNGEKPDYQQALPLLSGEKAGKELRAYDTFLYKERNVIEKMFGKMKHLRSVATRYSKTTVSYLAFIQFAAILLWLK